MRDPTLIVKKSDLIKIFKEIGIELTPVDWQTLFVKAKNSCLHRHLIKAKAQKRAKYQKIQDAGDAYVDTIIAQYQNVMFQKNIAVPLVGRQDAQYETFRKITRHILEFNRTFQYELVEGAIHFFQLAVQLMDKKFSVNKIPYNVGKIFEREECRLAITLDPYAIKTDRMIKYYKSRVARASGFKPRLEYRHHVHFVYARMEAMEIGARLQDWLDAQFDGMEFMGIVPEPHQLYGEGARDRFLKSKLQVSPQKATENALLEELKKLKDDSKN